MIAVFEDLRVLQAAEALADALWRDVVHWDAFARDVFGSQLARAMDSVGANIAEAYGRFHYGDKLQFLYYARGSLFEAKYWLNRSGERSLLTTEQRQTYATQITSLARQLNAFVGNIKSHRTSVAKAGPVLQEVSPDYHISPEDVSMALFSDEEIEWLESLPHLSPQRLPADPIITTYQ